MFKCLKISRDLVKKKFNTTYVMGGGREIYVGE